MKKYQNVKIHIRFQFFQKHWYCTFLIPKSEHITLSELGERSLWSLTKNQRKKSELSFVFFDVRIWISPLWFLPRFGQISNGSISRNTGPIPIIFGALESYEFSLSSEIGLVSTQQKPFLTLICLPWEKRLAVGRMK